MGLFPKVESPCPYVDRLDDVITDDFCAMCERNVFDLTEMSSKDRQIFMASCSGEVCVSYKIPAKLPGRKLATSAALTLAVLPGLAAAQDAPQQTTDNEDLYCQWDEIIVGGIRKAEEALWIDTEAEKHLSDIPETTDLVDNKDDALMLFALNGLEDDELSSNETVKVALKED